MTNEQLFQVLRPLIVQVTGVPTILADQNVKAPTGPYCTIRPRQSVRMRGQALMSTTISGPLHDVTTTIKRQILATCSIQFYRGEARQCAELVAEMNKLPTVSMALLKAKCGWGGAGPVNDITALQSSNWEQRAAVDVVLMYETTSQDTVNAILSAEVQVQNEQGKLLQTLSVTTP
jgi:hypothetical protein